MRRAAVVTFLLLACTPHEGEGSPLFAAPGADPMPESPRSAVMARERAIAAPESDQGCDPVVAGSPTALFGDRVLIRMPRGVEMLEQNPTLASAVASGGFVVTCDAVLRRATLMLFANEAKSLGDYARQVTEYLEKGGYVAARDVLWSSPKSNGRRGTVVVPAMNGLPETELLLDLRRYKDFVILLVYEAQPDDFARLLPSLMLSADSLLVAPAP